MTNPSIVTCLSPCNGGHFPEGGGRASADRKYTFLQAFRNRGILVIARIAAWIHASVLFHVRYVCMYVCMFVCLFVCLYVTESDSVRLVVDHNRPGVGGGGP